MSPREQIIDILRTVTETPTLKDDPSVLLYDTGVLDSMRTVELIVALSREFGIDISPAEFDREQWATSTKIIEFVEAKMSQAV